ncbi:MAG TPA: hypothetical protein PK971_16710, partial [Saprospiraceae bacterium]|nr:hypothetical protein [Saprospiraceae bacterium]
TLPPCLSRLCPAKASVACAVLWLCSLLSPPLHAQSLSTADILQSALLDERLALNQQTIAYARSLRYQVPLLRRIEGRIGINGSTLGDTIFGTIHNEDFYGLVLAPNSIRERRRQAQLKAAQINIYEQERAVLLQQILLERYQTLVGLHFAQRLDTARQELLRLLGKKEALLRDMLDRGLEVKVKDALDTEDDRNALELSLSDLAHARAAHLARLKQWLPPEAAGQWRGTDFLSPAALARRVASLRLSPTLSASLAYREAQTRHAAADWALEDAQNRQVFNFLQLAYQDPVVTPDRPKKFNAFNNFSARVALALPMPGNNNPKRSEAALQLREAEVSAQTARLLLEKNLELQQVRIDNLLDQQRICQAKIDSSLIRKMLDNPALCAQMS